MPDSILILHTMLKTDDFDYELPENLIAPRPVGERSASRLLVYQNGEISHSLFSKIGDHLPGNSRLILNDSKVIPARLFFKNPTGAEIEILLLEPSVDDHGKALNSVGRTIWKCMVGNRKRWKSGQELLAEAGGIKLLACPHDQEADIIEFRWTSGHAFVEVLDMLGAIPLPPYLNRDATEEDRERYQTVYAVSPGAVAAPTAGLHFNRELLEDLTKAGHRPSYLTLHVGAGTFLPVKTENALKHRMHEEHADFQLPFINSLLNSSSPVIPVGTTSMRALESLYWKGVTLINGADPGDFRISQNLPYDFGYALPDRATALKAVINHMNHGGLERLHLSTSIFIRPGYRFGLCDGLITNFHQPRSTLLMLVCALIGPNWRKMYQAALENKYRFLSYGDSSLLMP